MSGHQIGGPEPGGQRQFVAAARGPRHLARRHDRLSAEPATTALTGPDRDHGGQDSDLPDETLL